MSNSVVVNSPTTVVKPIKDDDCEPKPEPKPEPECCGKTYHIVLHFH